MKEALGQLLAADFPSAWQRTSSKRKLEEVPPSVLPPPSPSSDIGDCVDEGAVSNDGRDSGAEIPAVIPIDHSGSQSVVLDD